MPSAGEKVMQPLDTGDGDTVRFDVQINGFIQSLPIRHPRSVRRGQRQR